MKTGIKYMTKRKNPKDKLKGGRPTKMTELTVKKLEEAFSNGASDVEACFIAGISKECLYQYQDKFPSFVDRKFALKEMIKYQAKIKVKQAIEKEKQPDTAKWYLERKDKEFKNKTDITSDDKPVAIIPLSEQNVSRNNSNNQDKETTE